MNLPIQPIPISRSRQASPRPPSPQQTDPQLAQLDILGAFDPLAQDTKESNNLNGQGISSGNLAEAPIAEDDDFGGFVSVDSQGNSSSFSDFAISPTNGEGMLSLRRVSTSPTSQRRSSLSPTSPPRRLSSIMTSTSPPNPLSSTVQFSPSSPDTFRPTPPNEDFFASIEAQAPTTFKTSAFRFSPQPQTSPSNFFSATISKSLKNRWHGQNETKESRPAIPTFRPRKVSAPTLTTPTKEGEEEGWLSDQIQTASQTEVLDVPVPISPLRRATSHEILPEVRLLDRNIETEVIVTHNIVEQLRIHLPAQQRLAKSWRLLYSLDQHGISLHTMYKKVFDQGPLVMAVRDADDGVFGAFVNEAFHPHASYYGNGECFLWKSTRHTLRAYKWTGRNEYMILSETAFVSVGGGDGKFGLWLDSDFDKGVSSQCPAFNNEVLSATGERFECAGLEVWAFGGL